MKTKPRWIPEDSIPILDPKDNGIVYLYAIGERYAAIAYKGNAGKSSWHYSYRTLEEAHKKAQEFFAGLASAKERHAKWRAEANKPHSLKVGDIIANSWGYEQTNVDWYRVTRTSEHFVWLMPSPPTSRKTVSCPARARRKSTPAARIRPSGISPI